MFLSDFAEFNVGVKVLKGIGNNPNKTALAALAGGTLLQSTRKSSPDDKRSFGRRLKDNAIVNAGVGAGALTAYNFLDKNQFNKNLFRLTGGSPSQGLKKARIPLGLVAGLGAAYGGGKLADKYIEKTNKKRSYNQRSQ